jgi:hypothetical protein
MLKALYEQGAAARAAGAQLDDNPLYRVESLPIFNDESVFEWEAKAGAWEAGWRLEHSLRPLFFYSDHRDSEAAPY